MGEAFKMEIIRKLKEWDLVKYDFGYEYIHRITNKRIGIFDTEEAALKDNPEYEGRGKKKLLLLGKEIREALNKRGGNLDYFAGTIITGKIENFLRKAFS